MQGLLLHMEEGLAFYGILKNAGINMQYETNEIYRVLQKFWPIGTAVFVKKSGVMNFEAINMVNSFLRVSPFPYLRVSPFPYHIISFFVIVIIIVFDDLSPLKRETEIPW